MTEPNDHPKDMAEQAAFSDATVDALLAGEPARRDGDAAAVARFLDAMRAAASETPGPPSAALASVLEKGFPGPGEATVPATSTSTPTRTMPAVGAAEPTAPVVQLDTRRAPRWQRKVAAVAAGLTVAVGGVTGAAALGLLPDSVSRAVGDVFEALTPFEAPASLRPDSPTAPEDVAPDAGDPDDGTPDRVPADPGVSPGSGQSPAPGSGSPQTGPNGVGSGSGGANPSPGGAGPGAPPNPATDPPLNFPLPVAPAPTVPGVPGQPTPAPPPVPAPPTVPTVPVPTTPSGLRLPTP